ncbi:MAG TPA: hypothetical protein VGR32_05120 [Brevundimonas sp.]|jgi:hypothetical protein|uniref:hypothetical protein n=1 Tax=Brevundimonas sp. TaxID=1871086 RepID=UPI002DED009F|nr:hypothetical protein [Brevundimonas sp.]
MIWDHDATPPADILAQFAEGAMAHIDARSITRFQATLREMREYHRLLLKLYATTDPKGRPDSYALLDDGLRPYHQSWMEPYRAVITRAVSRISEEPEYFRSVVYIPYGLLVGEQRLAPQIVKALLRLGPFTVFRLEEWLSRRAAAIGVERAEDSPVKLIGSDQRAYENAMMDFVSAWESTARPTNTYRHMDEAWPDLESQWRDYRLDWPGLRAHCEATAAAFVAAVWNQDPVGVSRLADLLLRWNANLHMGGDVFAFRHPWLVTGDVMSLEWSAARAAISHTLHEEPWDEPTPAGLFRIVVQNLHRHTVLLTAAVVLNWTLTGKGGGFAFDAAKRLIDNQLLEEEEPARTNGMRFADRLQALIAMESIGLPHAEKGYGAALDSWVSSLDNVSERRVTTGRVYTPSTVHDRDSLSRALDIILLASTRQNAAAYGLNTLRSLVERDTTDLAAVTRRNLVQRFQSLGRTVAEADQDVMLAVQNFDHDVNVLQAFDEGRDLANRAEIYLAGIQADRIARAPISPERLRSFRDTVANRLLAGQDIPFFQNVSIGLTDETQRDPVTRIVPNMDRNEFLDPEIEPQSSNYIEVFAGAAAEQLIAPLWASFLARPIQDVLLKSRPDSLRFWTAITERASKLGREYILILSGSAYRLFEDRWVNADSHADELDVEYRRERDRRTYRRSVGDLDIHEFETQRVMEGFLIPTDLLREVRYARQPGGNVVDADWLENAEQPRQGRIRLRYTPIYVWEDKPIVRIRFRN